MGSSCNDVSFGESRRHFAGGGGGGGRCLICGYHFRVTKYMKTITSLRFRTAENITDFIINKCI